jgi:hypothetical protein
MHTYHLAAELAITVSPHLVACAHWRNLLPRDVIPQVRHQLNPISCIHNNHHTMSVLTPPPGQYTVLRIKRKANEAPLSSLGELAVA